MRSWTVIFLALVVLVIPVFFIGLFVMSMYYKLVALRDRCRLAHADLKHPAAEEEMVARRSAYNESVRNYNAARQRFPTSIIAAICRFPPAEALND